MNLPIIRNKKPFCKLAGARLEAVKQAFRDYNAENPEFPFFDLQEFYLKKYEPPQTLDFSYKGPGVV